MLHFAIPNKMLAQFRFFTIFLLYTKLLQIRNSYQKMVVYKNKQLTTTQATTEDILFCLFQDVFFGVRNVACRSNTVATFLLQIKSANGCEAK